MAAQAWNPRYVAYAAAHGARPEAMLVHDRVRWPGGHMAGYIIWINAAWTQWARETQHPRSRNRDTSMSRADHAAFDTWLARTPQTSTD